MNTEIGLQILRNQLSMMNALTYCIRGQPDAVLTQQLISNMSLEFYKSFDLMNQRSLHESELMQLSKRGFGTEN